MKVCESCIAKGYHERLYNGDRIRVLCDACHGTGSISLGPESAKRWDALHEAATATAIREGWYRNAWEGTPGNFRRVLKRIGPAEFVARTA